ncbi:MAG: hypothetical protein JWQ81_5141 [Amycolatopsis sp.]|uniref:winged helix DNA-binding domain-containing protein n=1 Tax=Amycolatopsis sp. TaxID=37632 RepID=UPI002626F967|nr:winged helix DNA-binding domain-containing protein [Amycolatopsis sp.]MCU1684402.1 hypothetical protein [Amycolatopsis sp.]
MPPIETLSLRALNRATLARQLLLRRAKLAAAEAIEQLGGLQAQAPFAPYFGLWSRLHGFRPEQLSQLIESREVVRIALMRGTVHLVTAADALAWRPLVQVIYDRDLLANTQYAAGLAGLDFDAVSTTARELLGTRTHTTKELGAALAERWPDRDPSSLTHAARGLLPLVQVPPRGIWGKAGQPAYATTDDWLGRPLDAEPSLDLLVERYLAAFGPASVKDAQTWAGITKLSAVFERLRPRLRTFVSEDGRELFDLPEAPRPDPSSPAPPRLLGPFDQMILSYADRTRVISDAHRKRVITQNGLVKGALLVDGFVNGFWEIQRKRDTATATLTAFDRIPKRDIAGLESSAARLLAFAEPDAVHDVRWQDW